MNDYADLTCMVLDDEKYSKNQKVLSASIKLSCNINDICKNENHNKCQSICKNMPVCYNGGVFRIESISGGCGVLKVILHGDFSEKDPNGHALNGWTNDEISNSSTQEPTSPVGSLEV